MGLLPRNRVPPISVLQTDYEYCSISYYLEGSRNDLGEPSRTLTQRSSSVKCSIDPLTRMPAYIGRRGVREILRQGIIEQAVFFMIIAADQTVEAGDVIENVDGDQFDVLHCVDWSTHKEAFLRKMN